MDDDVEILTSVRKLVERLAPTDVCAPCIADRIENADLEAVSIALSALAASRDFERDNGDCGLCGDHRLTIRKRR